ncbi:MULTISPECIES: hypothetical protein [Mycobacterium]|uniref:Uncharacterized protein n=3 Tax=Mycobacterium TaxID=1763 RepID=A0A1X1YIV8_9MYCO|nr:MULTISPECIES: hypothetical protein [Mycobacterium]ORW11059.1 hypothetical protein AWC14_19270 [Mycobacterium kyorinense]SPX88365.1 Uncharacterised protein [Mycobacterium xenopi]
MVLIHQHARSNHIKRHARLRDHDFGRPLWAGDDDDWKVVLANRKAVICDVPGCRQPLVPKDCTQSQRHLAYPRGSAGGCGHHILGSDEKPETDRRMSERHRWMQNRITAICRQLGYTAVPEHWPTRADVYVETTKTALEVQQRPTAFAKRTAARARHGACQTIWLLSHDARGDSVERALFGLPAVRFKIVDLRRIGPDRTIEFEPWTDPTALNEFAVVDVWATTWQLVDEKPYLRRCKMDLHIFLDQVLSGRRIWVRANPVMPRGGKHNQAYAGWVLHEDLLEASRRQACDVEDEAKAVAVQPITADRKNTALVAPDQTPKPVAALRPPPVEPPISPERAMKESAAAQTQSPTTTQAKPPRPRQAPHPVSAPRVTYEDVEKVLDVVAIGIAIVIGIAFVVQLLHLVSPLL